MSYLFLFLLNHDICVLYSSQIEKRKMVLMSIIGGGKANMERKKLD